MNYIQEELLRQRRALAALMSGTTAEETEERENNSGAERAAKKSSGPENVAWESSESAASFQDTGEAMKRAGGTRKEELSASREAAAGWQDGETSGNHKDGALRSSAPKRSGGWTALRRTEPWQAGSGAAGTEQPATDLRAVSQGFQRDARRYDGGFSAY